MTSLEGVPRRHRRGADLPICVPVGARSCPALRMANDTLIAR
jgi:hypothetical protein